MQCFAIFRDVGLVLPAAELKHIAKTIKTFAAEKRMAIRVVKVVVEMP